ncbi:hypothetical protein K7432_017470 [Basidiobolus ranarum]|uniref:Uncharacterized protein n=1 Tax=Basidiobolus ranarum TaxID=34480 RepID=A0ABR2VLD6_9FUNG
MCKQDHEKQPKIDENSTFSHQILISEKNFENLSPAVSSTKPEMVSWPKLVPEVVVPISHLKRSNQTRSPPDYYSHTGQKEPSANLAFSDESKSVQEAMESPNTKFWSAAMAEEYQSLINNQA